jgi:hypothetical protein
MWPVVSSTQVRPAGDLRGGDGAGDMLRFGRNANSVEHPSIRYECHCRRDYDPNTENHGGKGPPCASHQERKTDPGQDDRRFWRAGTGAAHPAAGLRRDRRRGESVGQDRRVYRRRGVRSGGIWPRRRLEWRQDRTRVALSLQTFSRRDQQRPDLPPHAVLFQHPIRIAAALPADRHPDPDGAKRVGRAAVGVCAHQPVVSDQPGAPVLPRRARHRDAGAGVGGGSDLSDPRCTIPPGIPIPGAGLLRPMGGDAGQRQRALPGACRMAAGVRSRRHPVELGVAPLLWRGPGRGWVLEQT